MYGEESKPPKKIVCHYANLLRLYCSGDVVPCCKDTLVLNEETFDQKIIAKCLKETLKQNFFRM